MKKLIVFDLDHTLAPLDKPALPETLSALRELEDRGVKIAVCSGKNISYLCGFLRQAGLREPILMGELGASIQYGVSLPPKRKVLFPCPPQAREAIAHIRSRVEKELGEEVWFLKNDVTFAPFPCSPEARAKLDNILDDMAEETACLELYRYPEAMDIVPKELSKGAALRFVCALEGIDPADACAVGDGRNDIPMFEAAGLGIAISPVPLPHASLRFDTIQEALFCLLRE